MKKRIIGLLCVGVLAVGMLAGCGGAGGDAAPAGSAGGEAAPAASAGEEAAAPAVENTGETYTLIVHQHDPEGSATGQFLNAWAAAVEEASGGQLDIQVMHGGTMGGPKDTVDMIKNGTCDIGWGLQSFFADTFPVTEVFQLPGLDIARATQGSAAIWQFYNETDYMDAEYADFHVLYLHTNCQSPISTVSKKIESVSDIQGMQLRGNAGPPTMFIQNLGANPVSVPINDLYSNLDKGTIDGCITDWHAISDRGFKLYETIDYFLDENIGVSTYFLMMNKEKYESLPDDLKQVLDEVSADSAQYTSAWDETEDEIKAQVADKLYTLEDRSELDAIIDQTTEQWIAAMNDKGYDGQAIYDKAVECIEANK